MRIIEPSRRIHSYKNNRGVSLIELIVFIVVVSIALTALLAVYIQSNRNSVDPIIRVRLLEASQSRLDEIIALQYDETTPSGGIPACGSTGTGALACTNSPDSNMNDVDDFHNLSDTPYPNYNRQVTVTTDGDRKLISVTTTAPDGQAMTLSAYRYNF
jgi:MSHA pilin protein MshD